MPPPKKAGKKAAKKSAKKAAKKAPGSRRGQDLRRCYEHFGRVSTLLPLLDDRDTVTRMATLAQDLLRTGETKDAADLLRAAEHLCFGSLALGASPESISAQLVETMQEEYTHLLERADHHAAAGLMPPPVARLFSGLRKAAVGARKADRPRAASEFARGAEALAHVSADFTGRLRMGDLNRLEPEN